ncbi:MAG: GNAT family N-acetyltransferase [Pseudomonadota bacterium]
MLGVDLAAEDPRTADGRALIGELNRAMLALYPESAWPFVTAEQLADGGCFVVARERGAALGCGGLMPVEPGEMEVTRMYLRPEARGRRISSAILAALEHEARRRGAKRLVLETGPRQPEAIRLYERKGFARSGPFGPHQEHPLSLFYAKALP